MKPKMWHVSAPHGPKVHRYIGIGRPQIGSKTLCGQSLRIGWCAWLPGENGPHWGDLLGSYCKRCGH